MSERLPRRCECGGKMTYARSFGRIFSACESCTPVVTIRRPRTLRALARPHDGQPNPADPTRPA